MSGTVLLTGVAGFIGMHVPEALFAAWFRAWHGVG